MVTDHGEATVDLEILTRTSTGVTLKCHEPRTYSAVKIIYSTNPPRDRLLQFDRPEDRDRLQQAEALAVVLPQVRFLAPSAVSADPVDPPFMQDFENLKIYNLYDRAFPFVTFAHRLQRSSIGLRGDPLRQMTLFSTKFWSCYN